MHVSHIPVKHHNSCDDMVAVAESKQNIRMKNIARIRKSAGLSQADLAEIADVNQATISKLENGHLNVSMITLSRIATALNVPITALIGLPELQQRAVEAISKLGSDEQQKAALVVLEAMISNE